MRLRMRTLWVPLLLLRMRTLLVPLLFLALLAAGGTHGRVAPEESNRGSSNRRAMPEWEAAEEHLQLVNRPFVDSITLSDGTTVDCVRLQDQLALQHPLLKDHAILSAPSFPPTEAGEPVRASTRKETPAPTFQLFHREKGSCPSGTIPVRRTRLEDLQGISDPGAHPRKYNTGSSNVSRTISAGSRTFQPPGASGSHEYAIVEATGSFTGAMSYISTWAPFVAAPADFSLSQLWVGAGVGSSINTVEAGWQVYPLLSGDYRPHLFIYWTADGYSSTGCYNLRCPAFVQISPAVVLGGAMAAVSSPGSAVFYQKFLLYKDPVAWWLQIDGSWIGYWPAFLFNSLAVSSKWIQWGGEVCLTTPASANTDMGSGFFPSTGAARAATHNTLSSVDAALSPRDQGGLFMFTSDSSRYAAQVQYHTSSGTELLFGGPGQ